MSRPPEETAARRRVREPNEQRFTCSIGERIIGSGRRCFIVAEIGVNHQGSVDRALALVDAAAEAGADAVKLQKRCLSALYTRDVLERTHAYERPYQYLIPILRRVELSEEDVRRVAAHAAQRGLVFLCTAFDLPSAQFVASLGVPAFKIASCDLTNWELIDFLLAYRRPLIVSTGASTDAEIARTVRRIRRARVPFALLHCNTTYPTRLEDVHLRSMVRLQRFRAPFGYSGHETSVAVPVAAVAMGASIVEKHITFDRNLEGPDHRASLLPEEFARMVQGIREVERALGSPEKRITQGEILNREVLGKSLVARVPIRRGEVISRDAVCARSPARGLSPQRIGELLYRRARRDMEPDEYFTEADVSATGGDDGAVEAFGKWGIIVRPDDYAAADRWQPPVLEFHLTPRDLEREWSMRAMPCELVVHVPEYCSDEELLDLCVPDLRKRRHAIRFVVGVLDRVRSIAAYFRGRAKVVVHPGGATLGEVSAGARARMRAIFTESYHELRGEAERLGLTILPENLPPFPWYFGGQWRSQVFVDPREVLEFAHREGAPICLDTSHAQLACTVLERAMVPEAARLRPFVRHLHVADAAGTNGEGVQIGEGDVDFRGLLEAYERYDESWVPEIWQGHHNGHEGFRIAFRRLMELRASRCAS